VPETRAKVKNVEPRQPAVEIPDWSPATLLAFRFSFIYLGLFCLASQIAGSLFLLPFGSFRGLGTTWPMVDITQWLAPHVFGVTSPLVFGRYSGETLFFWIQTFWILSVAILGTITWSILDRHRKNYSTLHKWFRLFVRFALAASMFEYGMTKVIPVQFARPTLNTLVTPVGNLSLSNLLWTSIGAAPVYEVFTGCAEILGGILLLVPRTTTLGTLICLADMTQVFVLNMTYDIGVKQISFHLIVLGLFLLAPEFQRLIDFFFFPDKSARSSTQVQLFATPRLNRYALIVQLALGFYLIAIQVAANWTFWYAAGDRSPRSPLYGIWNVDQLSIDGQPVPALLADYDRRWRRVIFDTPNNVAFQRFDDSFARYVASLNIYGHTLSLAKANSKAWRADFSFERPSSDHLTLSGEMDGHKIDLKLELVDFDTFRLLNSSFRWVRPEDQ
jgi:hypothetical protein